MAAIIQKTSQLEALEEIQAELTQIENLNYALTNRVSYHVMAVDDTSAALRVKGRATIPLETRATEKVDNILKAQRDRLVKAVLQKADKFEISLDDEDNAILNGGSPRAKVRGKKAQAAEKPADETEDIQEAEDGPETSEDFAEQAESTQDVEDNPETEPIGGTAVPEQEAKEPDWSDSGWSQMSAY